MDYKYGDICVKKEKLNKFLQNMPKGEYTTFDILKKYQGDIKRNKGISVGASWNAHFGKILKQCAGETQGIIKNTAIKEKITVDSGETETALWQIL